MSTKRKTAPAPVTKADLTEAMDRVLQVTKADLTQAISQVMEEVKETRLQLERKIDWVRQDAKEQLEGVARQFNGRVDRVEAELHRTQVVVMETRQDVKTLQQDMQAVKGTLAEHGQKLDRLTEKVAAHGHAIEILQAAS